MQRIGSLTATGMVQGLRSIDGETSTENRTRTRRLIKGVFEPTSLSFFFSFFFFFFFFPQENGWRVGRGKEILLVRDALDQNVGSSAVFGASVFAINAAPNLEPIPGGG